MNQVLLDQDGIPVAVGDYVRIVDIPEEIPEGLPEEDQIAIRAQVGKIMVIQDFNNDGAAELEFVDDAGHIHTIWIDPDCLAYIGQNM